MEKVTDMPTQEEHDAIMNMSLKVEIPIEGGAPKLSVTFPVGTPEAVCANIRRVVMQKEKEVVTELLQKAAKETGK